MISSIKKQIPNTITALNLFSGCIGILFALQSDWVGVAWAMALSGIFDFCDGLVARLLKVKSAIGKELDSLADVVSFGALPGFIYYSLLGELYGADSWLPYAGFIVPMFSAFRLAKFNLDERQSVDFVGLNTPMNAFFTLSLAFISTDYEWIKAYPSVLLLCIVFSSALLVSEFRLFSMKFDNLTWGDNKFRFIFLIISIVLIYLLKFVAIPGVLVLYFLLSYLHFNKRL